MKKKHLLREIVDQYIQFSETGRTQELADFSAWLYDRNVSEVPVELNPAIRAEIIDKGLTLTIAEHWGRLAQFTGIWSKLAFQPIPMKTFSEYGLLKFVAMLKHPTKSDLVEMSMLEKSTCYEIIRRLQKLDLISEKPDPVDKRIKRVQLTALGEQWLAAGDQQLAKIAQLLVGDLNEERQVLLLDLLAKLNSFHSHLYAQDHEDIRTKYL